MSAEELAVSAARSLHGLRALDLSLTRQRPQLVVSSPSAPCRFQSRAPLSSSARSVGIPDRPKVEKAEPTSDEESEEETPMPGPPGPVEREQTRSPREPSPSHCAAPKAASAFSASIGSCRATQASYPLDLFGS